MEFGILLSLIENSKPRLLLSLVLAGVVFMLISPASLEFRLLAAWDTGVLCFLILVGLMMIGANHHSSFVTLGK